MKNIILIACIALTSCSQKLYSPQITNNPNTEDGTIRINVRGLGDGLSDAYDNAVENAFSTLLFRGIPESIQSTPLIPDEASAKNQFPDIMACFKDKKCYSQFITRATQEGEKEKVKGGYQVVSDVTINIRALRTYLEKNNVIRKFGF